MKWFEFRGHSCRVSLLADMKKSDFEKEFSRLWKKKELLQGWEHLQKLIKESKNLKKGISTDDKE